MFLICAFNREHDLQIYSKAQWYIPILETRFDAISIHAMVGSIKRRSRSYDVKADYPSH